MRSSPKFYKLWKRLRNYDVNWFKSEMHQRIKSYIFEAIYTEEDFPNKLYQHIFFKSIKDTELLEYERPDLYLI